ncbi:unnamed protein product [Brassica oleracea]
MAETKKKKETMAVTKLARLRKRNEFRKKLAESGGFDIEHLMKKKPHSCDITAWKVSKDHCPLDNIIVYAKLGIHKYNMIQGTNLQLSSIEKYNVRPKVAYFTYFVTAVAKDPAVGGSLITFQTSSYIQGFDVKSLTCFIARPKPEPHGKSGVFYLLCVEDQGDNRPTECGPIDRGRLPEWPADNAFDDKTRYYMVKKSELRKNDWIRLYLELAFLDSNLSLPNINLSKLVIMKVAVETRENMESPKERLNARNATFYIKYKYCPNKSRRACKVDGCRATRERIAIIRRSLDKLSGLLTLSFHGHWKHTFL